jgi:hypothetical protein
MIGRRGFPTLEPPRARAGPARPAPVRRARNRMRIASWPGPRAPPVQAPGSARSPVTERAARIRDVIAMPAPEKALGQRRRR